jgi:hypothetical protein
LLNINKIMKYFIEGRERKIYFTKDNTAFYKSKGHNVDVTYMFKKTKNGLELRKKYLKTGGGEDDDPSVKNPIGFHQKATEFLFPSKKKKREEKEEEEEEKKNQEHWRKIEQDRSKAAKDLKQELIKNIPSYFDELPDAIKLREAISNIDEALLSKFRKLFEIMSETPDITNNYLDRKSNNEFDKLYFELQDTSLKLANILNNIANDIADTDENLQVFSEGNRNGVNEYAFYYKGEGHEPIKLDIKSEEFEDIFVKVAWRYLGAKDDYFIGKNHSVGPDRQQAINDRIYMINALKKATDGVDVAKPTELTEAEVAAAEAEHQKLIKQQREAHELENRMREDMVGKGTGYGNFNNFTNLRTGPRRVSLDGGYKKTTKKTDKKTTKNTTKNTDRKSTRKAGKKTKK